MSIRITTLQNICIVLICIWAISPPLTISELARLVAGLAAAAWVGLELVRRDGIFQRPTLPVAMVGLYVFYTVMIVVADEGVSGITRNLQLYIMLMFVLFYESRRNDLASLRMVFWTVLLVLPVWIFTTNKIVLTENANAARLVVRSSEIATQLASEGVGGYALVYGSLLALPALISLVLRPRDIAVTGLPAILRTIPLAGFMILFVNVVLIVTLVLTAGYSIAVIALFSVVLSSTLLHNYSTVRIVLAVFLMAFAFLFSREIIETVLRGLLPLAQGTNFETKIRDILLSLQIESAVGSVSDRVERYQRSIWLFVDNPLFGTMTFDPVGKHSKILDDLAQFGIFVSGLFVYLIAFLPIQMMRRIKAGFGGPLATLIVALLCFGLNNPFAMVGVMLFIVFPVAADMLDGRERRRSPPDFAPVRDAA